MKKILLLFCNGVELMELSPFIDVFGWNNVISKQKIEVITTSSSDIVKSTWNISLKPETSIENIVVCEYDALVVPGGFGMGGYFDSIKEEGVKDLISNFARNKKLILGICTGAIALGEAGVLKNIKATTYRLENKRYFKQLTNYEAIPVDEDIVFSSNIITSSSPATAIPLAFYLLEVLTSIENTLIIKKNMGF